MSEAQLGIPRKVVLRVLNIEVGGVIVRLVWLRVMGLGKKTYIYVKHIDTNNSVVIARGKGVVVVEMGKGQENGD